MSEAFEHLLVQKALDEGVLLWLAPHDVVPVEPGPVGPDPNATSRRRIDDEEENVRYRTTREFALPANLTPALLTALARTERSGQFLNQRRRSCSDHITTLPSGSTTSRALVGLMATVAAAMGAPPANAKLVAWGPTR